MHVYLRRIQILLIFLSIVFSGHIVLAGTGTINGKIIDKQTGDAIIMANIYLEDTTLGSSSDPEGNYFISSVPEGKYTLIVSVIGYAETRITDLQIKADQKERLDVALSTEILTGEAIVVEARALHNTDAALLKQRQKANAVSDAISAETIARAGSGNAAEAMKMVTGASVVGGKYVYVRGLGERYSSTQLNGAELPTTDPDKRSFQMDLLPSNMLDNIVTIKSFTPDKPGNFSGGLVDIGTKSFPDNFSFNFSSSVGYNTVTSLKNNFLTYNGSEKDWLGYDNGTRQMPAIVRSSPNIPSESEARFDGQKAELLDKVSKAFNPAMAPGTAEAPLNSSYSVSIGDQSAIFGKPFGYIASFNYGNNFSNYSDGRIGRWKLSGNVSETDSLNNQLYVSDAKSSYEARWGGMLNFALRPQPDQEISLSYIHTQSGESSSRYEGGRWPEQLTGKNAFFETRVLQYTERMLNSLQLRGKNHSALLADAQIEWTAAFSESHQDEPDMRFFSDNYSIRNIAGRDTTIYSIAPSIYDRPSRYFRNLYERSRQMSINSGWSFSQWAGLRGKLKAGWAYNEKSRAFRERRFQYFQGSGLRYNGDALNFFNGDNVGLIKGDTPTSRYRFANYIQESPDPKGGNYDGDQRIIAGYVMVELPLTKKLQLISGARFEATRMQVSNADTSGFLHDNDWLPSLNMVYRIGENMNLRAAYGRTLARPNFREKAPYASFSFVNDFIFNGNVNLKRTVINNYDLRWEWFTAPGELMAVSGFYKQFRNPIEKVINVLSENSFARYENTDQAKVYGIEIEVRRNLESFSDYLNGFSIGSNLSLIKSEINIPDAELLLIRQLNANAADTRPLQGQSPYIINADLSYENRPQGTLASLYFNVFGERLAEVSTGGTPNVYEQPRPMLDLSVSQRVWQGLKLKASVKNLLNSNFRLTQTFKNTEYIRQAYESGRQFSLSANYSIN